MENLSPQAIVAICSYPRMHSKLFNTVVFMEEIIKIRKQVQDIELLDKDCREIHQKSVAEAEKKSKNIRTAYLEGNLPMNLPILRARTTK